MSDKSEILQLLYQNKISAKEALLRMKQSENNVTKPKEQGKKQDISRDIAIIGMSGQFPEAKNVNEYWDNLAQGKDSVKEITRWDLDTFYDGTGKDTKKSYSKWGGFLSDIDLFDPFFFELSPKQAELMEPRQRLFLLEAWRTFEDAGYSKEEVSGTRCGIFVGCEGSTEYFDQMKKDAMNAHVFLGHSNSVLASRIAYVMNLQGPCVTVDTACSSSLVSIHLACESLLSGACDMALAGGVNVMTTPGGYVLLSSMNALSYTGKCRAFDDGADGFVPGEAVGAILLKPLEQARKDHDHIYAVIKASMVNQDGKTNGIMAPSSLSQARLEKEVYELAKISPETINYIEAHGTGTKLGDPIEVNALKMAFADYTKEKQFCGLGSVKSNIGHASAASGVASMIKVLLSFKNQKLVPSLHFEKENSQLHLADSPFYVVNELTDWKRKNDLPRRAAVSSFGHGGTNCHILLEEPEETMEGRKLQHGKRIIVLSAKTKDSLLQKVENLEQWMQQEETPTEFVDISYTLSAGREHFAYRLGFVCEGKEELRKQLRKYRNDASAIHACGKLKPEELNALNKKAEGAVREMEQGSRFDSQLLQQILNLYLQGAHIAWKRLFGQEDVRRITMPSYPFQLRSYWIPKELQMTKEDAVGYKSLSSLVDVNESNLHEISYVKQFTGHEFFLQDHMGMLPAVVYMEMARQAGMIANEGRNVITLRNFVWANPILVEDSGKDVWIHFYPKENTVDVRITTKEGDNHELHAQGNLVYGVEPAVKTVNLESIKNRCQGGRELAQEFYQSIETNGVNLGRRFRGMVSFYYNEKEALSELAIPEELEAGFDQYKIHPTLTDGGFQTVINWAYHTDTDKDAIYLPFVLEELKIYNVCGRVKYAYVTKDQDGATYDVTYLDQDGKVFYEAKRFTFKAMTMQENLLNSSHNTGNEALYYHMQSIEANVEPALRVEENRKILVFDEESDVADALQSKFHANVCRVSKGASYTKVSDTLTFVSEKQEDFNRLFEEIPDRILYRWKQGGEIAVIHAMFRILIALSKCKLEHKVEILACDESESLDVRPLYDAFGGLFRNAFTENRHLVGKVMYTDVTHANDLARQIVEEFSQEFTDYEVEYKAGSRYVQRLREYQGEKTSKNVSFVEHGTYLITGGCGGLGYQIAQYLAKEYHANLILTGRSNPNAKSENILNEIRTLGGTAVYQKADVTKKVDCEQVKESILSGNAVLNGIIHTAGVVNDSMLVNKKEEELDAVLAPKVIGSRILVETFGEKVKDVIIFFSSLTAVVGNVGQSDYGYANSYMDAYARVLNEQGYRFKVISINWPLWKTGGMRMDVQAERMMDTMYGIKPLEFEQGIHIMKTAMEQGYGNLVPFYGNRAKIKAVLHKQEEKQANANSAVAIQTGNTEYYDQFEQDVVRIIAEVLKTDKDMLTATTNMDEYGFDSISYTELTNAMNQEFQLELTPTVFFGCATPKEIATNLSEDHGLELAEFYGNRQEKTIKEEKVVANETFERMVIEPPMEQKAVESNQSVLQEENEEYDPIAIIGYSCKMPGSDSGEEFWEHIKEGRDLVTEIPKDRWDWQEYYSDVATDEFKTNVKYGAFMKNINQFDPLFFKIAGLDTELMDPQERLVLENTWCAIEDAGYKASDLSNSNTGVFVGVSTADYKELLVQNQVTTIFSQAFIANRVSYVFNLKGPSEPIDTACSSSLVAIHRAIEQIHNKSCDMAIAGGVNVITCPNLYITQTKAGMLAVDGRCKTFDQSADGYGRGEGCGILLLKPLKKAKEDHDHIYGVIRGTAVAHGGHGNNIFSPNANEQAKVIQKALEVSHMNPSTISYIEAHGTGTSLGDPIEIDGIKKALKKVYEEYNQTMPSKKTIGIGTVKTNIGHLEAASGIAGLIKVLLSFKHHMLPKIVHFNQLNPYIELEGTPLYIVAQNKEWNRLIDENGKEIPRRAGISSFGIGGVNAHLVMEEYIEDKHEDYKQNEIRLLPVSAKSKRALKNMITNLKQCFHEPLSHKVAMTKQEIVTKLCEELARLLHVDESEIGLDLTLDVMKSDLLITMQYQQMIETEFGCECDLLWMQECKNLGELAEKIYLQVDPMDDSEENLSDIAYTLQCGREAMEERVVFLVRNMHELQEKCKAFLEEDEKAAGIVRGKVKRDAASHQISKDRLQQLLKEQNYEEIANAWVWGGFEDWSFLYSQENARPYHVSLPCYPFEREYYWIPDGKKVKKGKPGIPVEAQEKKKEKQQEDNDLLQFLKKMEQEREK